MKERPSGLNMGNGDSSVFYSKTMSSPFYQKKASYETTEEEHSKQNPYWYKIDGKVVSKYMYNKYKNIPGKMEGGGKTTNDPDPDGRKAKIKADREKLRKHTVLTKEQTKAKN